MASEGLSRLRLLLVRHGKAERNSATGEDEDRRLKPRGERQARFLGQQVKKDAAKPSTPGGDGPVLVLHSPVLRTVQTARLMAGRGGALELREEEALAVDQPARGVLGLIEANRERGYLVVVGHNPTLENVAAAVAPGMKGRGVNLRTGECLVFEVPEGQPLSKGTLVARWRLDEEDD